MGYTEYEMRICRVLLITAHNVSPKVGYDTFVVFRKTFFCYTSFDQNLNTKLVKTASIEMKFACQNSAKVTLPALNERLS